MADGQNRTHPATARRLQKARESGDVPLSREVVGFLAYVSACASLGLVGVNLVREAAMTLGAIFANLHNSEIVEVPGFRMALFVAAKLASPVLAASALGATLAVLVQTRFLWHSHAIRFDFSRLDPVKGFKRLFGSEGLIEITKSTTKILLMGFLAWLILVDKLHDLALLPSRDVIHLPTTIATIVLEMLLAAGLVQALMAVLDLAVVRLRFQLRHKMSREDLKDEFKETEGNPFNKSRIRRLQRAKRRQMTSAVRNATVVITNPTHFAVALIYDRAISAAPKIAAKGADLVAQRIRELAKTANVPIIESPALARALYRLEWDAEIPPEHYKAVAEIVAFVWRINGLSRRR
jgi:flagellar biosynthetic protein FlhB